MAQSEMIRQETTEFAWDRSFFRMREMQFIKEENGWQIEPQLTTSHVLMIVKDGQGHFMLNSHRYRLRPNTAYICSPDDTYGIEIEARSKMFLFKFDVFQRKGSRYECLSHHGECLFPLQGEIPVFPADRLILLCDEIYDHWRSEDELERFRCQLAFQQLLYYIMKHRSPLPKESRTSLEAAKNYMERYFYENLTIEQLARISNGTVKNFV
ncbi:AraC family ligand binding domain-containing protein [Geobacillus thermodenitrificans subsp. calidus]